MTLRPLALAALLAGPVHARAGDTVTPAAAADVAGMTRVAYAIDAAVDATDRPLARSFFADTIAVDFTSLPGGEPATIPADAPIEGWPSDLTAEKPSLHMRSNHAVAFDGPDAATMTSHGYARNRLEAGAGPAIGGDVMREVRGVHEHGIERAGDGRRVTSMSLDVAARRGNPFVRDTPGG